MSGLWCYLDKIMQIISSIVINLELLLTIVTLLSKMWFHKKLNMRHDIALHKIVWKGLGYIVCTLALCFPSLIHQYILTIQTQALWFSCSGYINLTCKKKGVIWLIFSINMQGGTFLHQLVFLYDKKISAFVRNNKHALSWFNFIVCSHWQESSWKIYM